MKMFGWFVLQMKCILYLEFMNNKEKYDTLKPTAFLICPKSLVTFIFGAATIQR